MIFDLHNDILTHETADVDGKLSDYISEQGTGKIVLAVWTTRLCEPLKSIPRLFEKAACSDKFCIAIEDLHFVKEPYFEQLHRWNDDRRILYAGLCWNHVNPLASGAFASGGLSKLGLKTVRQLEKIGICVDTAHLNSESFWDVVHAAKKPIINSHCCFFGVRSHERNLKDEQIRAIIESGGIVGLTLVPNFLSQNEAGIVDVFAHLDYFISRFGISNLAIGTDFFGSVAVYGLDDYTGFVTFGQFLRSKGYPENAIDAIFYKNAENFFFSNSSD